LKLYAVTDWSETYESAESKRYKRLPWMKLSADSEDDLLDLQDAFGDEAPAAFGCWTSIRLVATQSSTRGLLGDTHGKAYSPQRIATKAKMPLALTEKVLSWGEQSQRLTVQEVQVTHGSDPGATQQTDGLGNVTERKVRVSDASHPRPLAEPNETPVIKTSKSVDPAKEMAPEVVKAWNQFRTDYGMDNWRPARKVTKADMPKLRARIRDCGGPEEFATEFIDRLLRMTTSAHHRGENDWPPNLGFILQQTPWENFPEKYPLPSELKGPKHHDLDKHITAGGTLEEWEAGQYKDRPGSPLPALCGDGSEAAISAKRSSGLHGDDAGVPENPGTVPESADREVDRQSLRNLGDGQDESAHRFDFGPILSRVNGREDD